MGKNSFEVNPEPDYEEYGQALFGTPLNDFLMQHNKAAQEAALA